MTKLIDKKAPRGKFRVIADNFGQWRTKHSDILVGDFDTIDQARVAAQPGTESPVVRALVGDDLKRQRSHRMTEDIDKAALLAALREELAFVEFLDDLMGWGHATARREKESSARRLGELRPYNRRQVTSVRLSGANLEKLLAYRAASCAPMSHIVNAAVAEWFARTRDDRMKIFEGKQRQR